VNTIYVAADNSSAIGTVSGEITKALPADTVTTSADLASEVTGSLSNASSLANNLGKWLAIAVLVAAFLLASLLTMAAVSRRVREFGTLKALGWKSRRIIGQVMGEAVTMGIIGGAVGVGLPDLEDAAHPDLDDPDLDDPGFEDADPSPADTVTFD
jgi:ABC-type antimicrobial peptide transport system permease subunit